jgi:carbon monoxide dehydrogenase subunit G
MLQFEGDKDLAQAPEVVAAKLSDARFLVQCIPGVESVSRAEPDVAVWVLRPGFAFVRGTLEMTLRVVEVVPGSSARMTIHSKGIGSTSTVEAALTVAPRDGGSRVHWTAEVKELGGLLKAVPQGLIRASAQKVIADLWGLIEQKMAS